MARFASR